MAGPKPAALPLGYTPILKLALLAYHKIIPSLLNFAMAFIRIIKKNFKHTFFVHVPGYFRKSFQNMMSDGKRVMKKMVKAQDCRELFH